MPLPVLAARIFGCALLVDQRKLDAVVAALGDRLGLAEGFGEAVQLEAAERRSRKADAPALETRGAERPVRIGVVQVVGTLANRVSGIQAMSGATDYRKVGAEVDRLAADPEVDAILLEVDSFGGEAAGCFDLADRVYAARERKPVYGVADQYALSAGYAVISQAERLFVPQGGELGSIGVVSTHVDQTARAEREGVRVTHVHAGARKVDLSQFVSLSAEARDRLQADVDQTYGDFLRVVERGGRANAARARATEAATYIGKAAVDAGLADEVGTKAQALDALVAEVTKRRRAVDLEQENKRLAAEVDELRRKLAERDAEDARRQASEDAAYVEMLRAESAAAQAPIPEAKLERVKAYLAEGKRDLARELGDEMLEGARSRGAAAGGKYSAPKRTSLSAGASASAQDEHARTVARGKQRLLGRMGLEVELNDDRTAVLSVTDKRGANGARKG